MDNTLIFLSFIGWLVLAPFSLAAEVDSLALFEEKQMAQIGESGDFSRVQSHILAANGGELAAQRALLAFAYAAKNHKPEWIDSLFSCSGFSKEELRRDAIFNAIYYGWSKVLKKLFETSLEYGSQALLIACHYGKTKIVKFLIEEKKIDPTFRDKQGFSLLHHAVYSTNTYLLDYLMEVPRLRTELTTKTRNALIETARAANQRQMVKKLLCLDFGKSQLRKEY